MIKRPFLLVSWVLLLAGCGIHRHEQDDGHAHPQTTSSSTRPALSFTHWTESVELFLETRSFVRGEPSACAAHITKLVGFAPLEAGLVTVVLRGDGADERFESPAPSPPGIFRPIVVPGRSGKKRLVVEIRGPGIASDHDLGVITVFDSVADARATGKDEPAPGGRIGFLKEQQWPTDFATVVVTARGIRSSVRATGTLRPRSDGEVLVSAPVAGRVATSGAAFPRVGSRVSADEVLALLSPRLEAADLASLDLAVTSARLEVRFTEREQQRLEGLRTEGAVPDRRVQDATHAADEARASLAAAQRRLDQFRRAQRTTGRGEGTTALRAPLAGTITELRVGPGTFVEAGTPLFRITDLSRLWLEARVAEADAGLLGEPRGAWATFEGSETAIDLPADALVSRGPLVDPQSRTLSLLFAVDNTSPSLPLGAFARVWIATSEERQQLAVPASALLEDNGVFVVFVQVEGESFERRVVRIAARDRGFVAISSGLVAGEHVVTRGVWSVKLAGSGGSVPAHGHSH